MNVPRAQSPDFPHCFYKVKSLAGEPGFSGEGISVLMGCSKNYIMYWGGYVYYNSTGGEKSVHKHAFFSPPFTVKITSEFRKYESSSVFMLKTFLFFLKQMKSSLYAFTSVSAKRPSNSSCPIFSFSIRRAAQE